MKTAAIITLAKTILEPFAKSLWRNYRKNQDAKARSKVDNIRSDIGVAAGDSGAAGRVCEFEDVGGGDAG